jgi:hypothetical protein
MPGLVPGIHAFSFTGKDVDGRDKPGHDGDMQNRRRCYHFLPMRLNAASTTFSGVMPKCL